MNMLMSFINSAKIVGAFVLLSSVMIGASSAQSPQAQKPAPRDNAPSGVPAPSVNVPSDYLIGIGDVLTVVFWRDKDLSGEAVVRPDGKISLPMLNDVAAVGLT